ncbi:MAG: sensor histidine kinase [Planctomycetota bacterium]
MRWPIRLQMLLPVLLVVVVAIALVSAASAYFGNRQVRGQQEENLRRVIVTLPDAHFPLTERVLQQMRGLSGAEFVLLSASGELDAATIPLSATDLNALQQVPTRPAAELLSASPAIELSSVKYLSRRVPMARRPYSGEPGSLTVLYREDHWRGSARQAAYPAMIAGAISAAAAVLVTSVLAQRFVRPLQRLGDQTALIAAGGFLPVAVPQRNDEIRDLALCINSMTEKLSRYESEVRRSERLATLGQLGAGMAHQLRNGATGARMDIELHQRECTVNGNDGPPLHVALRELRLMESYLQRFLDMGRSRPMHHEKIALTDVVQEAFELVGPACAHHKVDLSFEKPREPLVVCGEVSSLRELTVNLLLNALEAAGRNASAGPKVVMALARCGSDRALLQVQDSGSGPSPEVATRIFEPFVSEKPDGTGLGLFVAQQVVEAHRGSITWRRNQGMTCFEVNLPLLTIETHHGASVDR